MDEDNEKTPEDILESLVQYYNKVAELLSYDKAISKRAPGRLTTDFSESYLSEIEDITTTMKASLGYCEQNLREFIAAASPFVKKNGYRLKNISSDVTTNDNGKKPRMPPKYKDLVSEAVTLRKRFYELFVKVYTIDTTQNETGNLSSNRKTGASSSNQRGAYFYPRSQFGSKDAIRAGYQLYASELSLLEKEMDIEGRGSFFSGHKGVQGTIAENIFSSGSKFERVVAKTLGVSIASGHLMFPLSTAGLDEEYADADGRNDAGGRSQLDVIFCRNRHLSSYSCRQNIPVSAVSMVLDVKSHLSVTASSITDAAEAAVKFVQADFDANLGGLFDPRMIGRGAAIVHSGKDKREDIENFSVPPPSENSADFLWILNRQFRLNMKRTAGKWLYDRCVNYKKRILELVALQEPAITYWEQKCSLYLDKTKAAVEEVFAKVSANEGKKKENQAEVRRLREWRTHMLRFERMAKYADEFAKRDELKKGADSFDKDGWVLVRASTVNDRLACGTI